jgi:hypothetical protein
VARTSIPSPSARTVPAPRSGDSWDSGCGPSGDPGRPKHSRASGCPGHSGCLPGAGMRGCGWFTRRGPATDGSRSGELWPPLKGQTLRPAPRHGPRESREEATRRHREPCPRQSH